MNYFIAIIRSQLKNEKRNRHSPKILLRKEAAKISTLQFPTPIQPFSPLL